MSPKVCSRCPRTHDTKFKACPVCRERLRRAVSKFKRKRKHKAPQHVPPGQRMCTNCDGVQPESEFQPADARRTELTKNCRTCRERSQRAKSKFKRKGAAQHVPPGHRMCINCTHVQPESEFQPQKVHQRERKELVSNCRTCRASKTRSDNKRAAQHVPSGHRGCTGCFRVQPESQFQPADARRTELTVLCQACRNAAYRTERNPDTRVGQCRQVWLEWRERNTCARCGTHKHIEADHSKGSKVHRCSDFKWWANHGGPEAQRRELATCTPLCKFCHRIKSDEERGTETNTSILWKRNIIDEEKRRVGACERCKLDVTPDTVMCFDWAHKDRATRTIHIAQLVYKPKAYFLKQWPIERPKCRMLCCMCHQDDTEEENRIIRLQAQSIQQ